jgi:hypothetical protein
VAAGITIKKLNTPEIIFFNMCLSFLMHLAAVNSVTVLFPLSSKTRWGEIG